MCLEETTAVRVDPMLERTGEEKKDPLLAELQKSAI